MTDNRALSEIYKTAGDEAADLIATATILEDTLTLKRAQRQMELMDQNPGMAVNKSELMIKAEQRSLDEVIEAANARKAANKALVYRDSVKMRHSEQMNHEANHRAEMRI